MRETRLFDAPLSVSRRFGPVAFPVGWTHQQVTMPQRRGVDALAGAVQLVEPGEPSDPDVAVAAAVRHWCGEDLGQLDVRAASVVELQREPAPVLRLADLELHDPALLNAPGCPLTRVDDDSILLWTRATRHRRDGSITAGWVPYGQSIVRWLDRDPDQPVAHTMNMTGLGAARTRDEAIAVACADLAAQDAVMTWWTYGGDDVLPALTAPRELAEAWNRSPLELRLRELPRTTGVSAALAVVLDAELDVATLAPAAGTDRIFRATAHALWQHAVAHDLLSADSSLHASQTSGRLPHRADRAYLDEAGGGWRRATDPLAAVQLGLDQVMLSRLDERTAATAGRSLQVGDDAVAPLEAMLGAGRDIWIVDLTTADARDAGWHCVRVLATGMSRIPVPAFPLNPRGRVALASRELGRHADAHEPLPYPGW